MIALPGVIPEQIDEAKLVAQRDRWPVPDQRPEGREPDFHDRAKVSPLIEGDELT